MHMLCVARSHASPSNMLLRTRGIEMEKSICGGGNGRTSTAAALAAAEPAVGTAATVDGAETQIKCIFERVLSLCHVNRG